MPSATRLIVNQDSNTPTVTLQSVLATLDACNLKWILVAALLAVLGSDLAQAAGKLSRFEVSQPHMGTEARIVVYAPSSEAAAVATRSAFERIRELDNVLSDYKTESELT